MVALPDGLPASVRHDHERAPARPAGGHGIRDIRDPHRHLALGRTLGHGSPRLAPVPRQRPVVRLPRRRLVGESLPALLGVIHGRRDRGDEEPRAKRHPHRGQADARELLRTDGPRGDADRRWLSMLRRLATPGLKTNQQERRRGALQLRPHDRRKPAQSPQRAELQLER